MEQPVDRPQHPRFRFRAIPAAAAAFGMGTAAGGLLLAAGVSVGAVLALTLLAAVAALVLRLIRFRRRAVFVLILALGLLRICAAYPAFTAEPGSYVLTGQVTQASRLQNGQQQVTLCRCALDGQAADGFVSLTLPSESSALHSGQRIRSRVTVAAPAADPRQRIQDFAYQRDLTAYGTACTVTENANDPVGQWFLRLREKLEQACGTLFGRQAGVMSAMLIGNRSAVPRDINLAFRSTGTAHLLAVSGLHLSILAGVVLSLFRRRHSPVRFAVLAAFVLFYCAITGFPPSVLRAALMLFYAQIAGLLGQRSDPLTSVSLAFVILCAAAPRQLFQAGFQLSFCAVFALILLHPVLQDHIHGPRPLANAVAVSAAASLGTLPVSASCFGAASLWTVVVNVLTVPLMILILAPGMLALAVYFLSPAAAAVIAVPAKAVLTVVESVSGLFAAAGTVSLPGFSLPASLLFFCALLLFSRYHLADRSRRLYSGGVMLVLSLLCALLLA